MFRQLKRKLTLVNVIVLSIVITLLMAGIYFITAQALVGQANIQMRVIAENAGSQKTDYNLRSEKYLPKDFYAKLDKNGTIVSSSPDLPVAKEELTSLVKKALANPEAKLLQADGVKYHFFQAPLAGDGGSVIVFVSTTLESLFMGHLLFAFIFAGIGGAALTLYCSSYLANKALVPIQKSWENQKNFVADASHEFRTPLSVIQTNLDIVLDNPEETVESQLMWLDNIKEESQHMTKLVEDLLVLARADSPQAAFKREEFALDQVVRTTVAAFEPVAARNEIELKTEIASGVAVHGDETRIKQLVAILLDNAIKYTPGPGEVRVALERTGKGVQLIVADTGEGIEEKHLEKIFDRFYRVDKARSRETGGTGLGLPIAESIVKAHGGTIKVTSVPAKGTKLTVGLGRTR